MGILKKIFLSFKYRGIRFSIALIIDSLTRSILYRLLSKDAYIKMKSLIRLGYIANLNTPQTFNEKILNKKFISNIDNLTDYADKYIVREMLQNKNHQAILNELFEVIENSNQLEFDKLPKRFVMKANHGSGMIKIIKDKNRINHSEIKGLAEKWLKTKYNESVGGTEYHYDAIKPKVIFEQILENKSGLPLLDYKFYCFNGKVEFIDIVDNSKGIPLMYVYDRNWSQLPFALYNKHIKGNFLKPSKFEEMVRIAENLSSEFDFVRIDLYLIDDDKIVFGEYTFFPGGGMLKFNPRKYDYIYGEKLKLDIL